jgi:hypothetical protein
LTPIVFELSKNPRPSKTLEPSKPSINYWTLEVSVTYLNINKRRRIYLDAWNMVGRGQDDELPGERTAVTTPSSGLPVDNNNTATTSTRAYPNMKQGRNGILKLLDC